MQFYIIHKDPKTNVKLLPEYAIHKVNIREGWQIISDIAHIHNVTWSSQNKCYSKSHVLTRSLCVNRDIFLNFIQHYIECLHVAKNMTYINKFNILLSESIDELIKSIPKNRTHEKFNLEYMLETKKDKLTQNEINILNKQLNTALY